MLIYLPKYKEFLWIIKGKIPNNFVNSPTVTNKSICMRLPCVYVYVCVCACACKLKLDG